MLANAADVASARLEKMMAKARETAAQTHEIRATVMISPQVGATGVDDRSLSLLVDRQQLPKFVKAVKKAGDQLA